jgi:hypothetical protein
MKSRMGFQLRQFPGMVLLSPRIGHFRLTTVKQRSQRHNDVR